MPTYTAVIDGYMILAAVGFDVLQPIQGGLTELRYSGHETSLAPTDRLTESLWAYLALGCTTSVKS